MSWRQLALDWLAAGCVGSAWRSARWVWLCCRFHPPTHTCRTGCPCSRCPPGTEEAPFLLEWMPDATTPDLLYYQCTIHMKLGWRVQVADA